MNLFEKMNRASPFQNLGFPPQTSAMRNGKKVPTRAIPKGPLLSSEIFSLRWDMEKAGWNFLKMNYDFLVFRSQDGTKFVVMGSKDPQIRYVSSQLAFQLLSAAGETSEKILEEASCF